MFRSSVLSIGSLHKEVFRFAQGQALSDRTELAAVATTSHGFRHLDFTLSSQRDTIK